MIEFTVHAIDGNADNVLGASFNWGETGSFTYHEMGTAVLTLIIPDNDTEIKNLNNGVQQLKSYNGIIVNTNTSIGGSWTVPGSDGSSFVAWRMRRPSIAFGDLMFSENVVDGVTYTLARFVAGGAAPYACIAPQIPVCFTPGTKITTPDGPQLLESLIPGNLVTTQDHGNQQIS